MRQSPIAPSRTDARADAAALPSPSSLLAALLPRLSTGVLLFNRDGSLIYMNDAAQALWATAHEGASSSVVDALITRGLLAGERARDVRVSIASRGPEDAPFGCHLAVNASPLRLENGEIDGLLVTVEDGTPQATMDRFRPAIESLSRL